ncbi:MAG TPA: ABC transporter permease [Gemmatimonadaceae bacterium]|nr:ABC transporter permease [Gemmatimonadaceae bacterium]
MIRRGIRRAFRLAIRRRDQWEREVEEEIKLHLALRSEELMARGATADEAYEKAVMKFGPLAESRARLVEAARHREHHMRRTEYLGDIRQDVSFALRSLRRQRGWTAVTLITLALGIGATTAVFSVVSTLLIHAIPYPNPDRIVYVDQQPIKKNNTGIAVSIVPSSPVVREWIKGSRTFETFEGTMVRDRDMKAGNELEPVTVAAVFPSFARFASQRPLIGRMFTQADIESGGRVALLAEPIWRERFGGSQGVLGTSVAFGDSSYRIIGVMPSSLRLPGYQPKPTDVWIPLDLRDPGLGVTVLGRLRPGVSTADAERDLDSVYARTTLASQLPFRTRVLTPAKRVHFYDSLVLLTAAVALVLLVACANVAHLLLARSATRHRELAIRTALGAGRGRLLRQLLTESILLTFAGAALGIASGWLGLRGLIALRPQTLDALRDARLDLTTLGTAIGVAVLSGIVFAILGAMQSSRWSTHDALKSGAPGTSQSRAERRVRAGLVVSEMAMSATLIVGAVMLVRSMVNLQRTDLGFTPHGLYFAPLPLARNGFTTPASREAFVGEFMRRVRNVPNVTSAAMSDVQPGWRSFNIGRLEIQGEPTANAPKTQLIDFDRVQSTYFTTMGIRLIEGTTFTDSTPDGHQVIVNAGLARTHWPQGSAIGHRVRVAATDSEPWLTIVGVAGNAATSGPATESATPQLYVPLPPDRASPSILLRTRGDARSLAPVLEIARSMGLRKPAPIESAEQRLSDTIAAPRFIMLVLTVFTILAVCIAAIGLYGVMAHRVVQETREIGIRVALGASRGRIGRAVVGRGLALTLVGTALGLAGAVWATKIIESQLHGVARLDPASFAVGALVLSGIAVLACVVPVRRALAIDPVTAIRAD